MVGGVTESGVLCELPHAGDLVLMSDTIKGLWNKFRKLKNNFESN